MRVLLWASQGTRVFSAERDSEAGEGQAGTEVPDSPERQPQFLHLDETGDRRRCVPAHEAESDRLSV